MNGGIPEFLPVAMSGPYEISELPRVKISITKRYIEKSAGQVPWHC